MTREVEGEIATIYKSIERDISEVDVVLLGLNSNASPLVKDLLKHVLTNGGKRVRPALTLLSAKFYNYDLQMLLPMVAAIELLHTATLVHDDTVDSSLTRRGKPTVNSLWGREVAILFGDYLFSSAACMACKTGNLRVMSLFAQTLRTISGGELNQMARRRELDLTPQVYFRDIGAKTAALFATATESGAIISRAPEPAIQSLKGYGYNLGIAFQVVDDILDFTGTEREMGKPVGSDLARGTITLPVILMLQRHPEGAHLKRLIGAGDNQQNTLMAVEMIRRSPAIEESYQIASEFCAKACQELEGLTDGVSKTTLTALAHYVVERRK